MQLALLLLQRSQLDARLRFGRPRLVQQTLQLIAPLLGRVQVSFQSGRKRKPRISIVFSRFSNDTFLDEALWKDVPSHPRRPQIVDIFAKRWVKTPSRIVERSDYQFVLVPQQKSGRSGFFFGGKGSRPTGNRSFNDHQYQNGFCITCYLRHLKSTPFPIKNEIWQKLRNGC